MLIRVKEMIALLQLYNEDTQLVIANPKDGFDDPILYNTKIIEEINPAREEYSGKYEDDLFEMSQRKTIDVLVIGR